MKKEDAGCLVASFSLTRIFIVSPLWFYVLYRVFTLSGATASDFVVFWSYVAFSTLFTILSVAVDLALKGKEASQ